MIIGGAFRAAGVGRNPGMFRLRRNLRAWIGLWVGEGFPANIAVLVDVSLWAVNQCRLEGRKRGAGRDQTPLQSRARWITPTQMSRRRITG